jgi:hypothetical protein
VQDHRRNLFRADLLGVDSLLQARVADETSDLAVVVAQSTMLSNFRVARGVARARGGSDDDIWDCGVFGGVAVALRDQCGAVDGLIDLQGYFILVKVRDDGGGVGGVVQEYETNIIGLRAVSNAFFVGETRKSRGTLR